MTREAGLLGPDSVAWKVIGHPVAIVGGLRALVIQSLHPLAMAGVAQHSDYRHRALERLRRTAYYVSATTFGDRETAHAAAARVKRMHRKVKGTDPVTGRPYSAQDPETQLWVHCVEWYSFLTVYRAYAGGLPERDADRYVAEGVRIAGLLGVPAGMVPASVAEMREYFAAVRPELRMSEYARDAIRFVVNPPLTAELIPLQVPLRIVAGAALATIPRDLRRLAEVDRHPALDALTVAAVRPAAIVLGAPLLREAPSLILGRETRAVGRQARAA